MKLGYLIILLVLMVVGIAVVRTVQLGSESNGTGERPLTSAFSQLIAEIATPTRSSPPIQIQPTVVKPASNPQVAINPTPVSPAVPPPQPANQAPSNGALVKWVDIPSAAHKIGIRQFDIITVFDGTPVDSNHFLVDLIERKKPGDIVDLTIVRGGQTLELSAQLRGSAWDNNVAYFGVQYVQTGSAPPQTR